MRSASPKAKMRRAYSKMWRVVPCTSKKTLRTESWKDIEEILQSKLATIMEEPEMSDDCITPQRSRQLANKVKKIQAKARMGCIFMPHFNLKDSYSVFINGFTSKGSFGGLLQY